jgi:hypothetical protein
VAAVVVDIHETPAVPPTDWEGDERFGYFLAGGLLIALGWGLGVVVNLLLHYLAGSQGMAVGWVRITSSLGSYAWAVFAFGLFTGVVGAVFLVIGRSSRKGPFVLPGYDY